MDAFVQSPEIVFQVLLVLVHRHPVDSWARCAPLPFERSPERLDIDVMQQRREAGLARSSGRRVHPQKVGQQGLPALCLALRRFLRVPLQPAPFLHHLVAFGDFIDTMGQSDFRPGYNIRRRSSLPCCPRW